MSHALFEHLEAEDLGPALHALRDKIKNELEFLFADEREECTRPLTLDDGRKVVGIQHDVVFIETTDENDQPPYKVNWYDLSTDDMMDVLNHSLEEPLTAIEY